MTPHDPHEKTREPTAPLEEPAHDRFWALYEARARGPVASACARTSRRLSGGQIDVDEMISWIDLKVWKLADRGGWPVFENEPTAEEAVARVIERADLLARWAYLAQVRGHWRRKSHEAEYADRVQRLAATHGEPQALERREDIKEKLDMIRKGLDADLRGKLAASWIDESDRKRIATGIGATREADSKMIEKTTEGDMKRNTVEQMRSRTLKKVREAIANRGRPLAILMAVGAFALASSNAFAGEGDQTGGRKGASMTERP
jgi:hypothetical protein